VLKVNGTPEFYQKVVDRLPDRIISKGSPDVDGISGATLSSNSMKEAIHHVLEKAEQNQ
jgi:fumarate reductase flavoprotein subunit